LLCYAVIYVKIHVKSADANVLPQVAAAAGVGGGDAENSSKAGSAGMVVLW